MVAICLYRGNLHRVADTPRRWPLPAPSLSLRQFKTLTRKRSLALARLISEKDRKEPSCDVPDSEFDALGAENDLALKTEVDESEKIDDVAAVKFEGDRDLGCGAADVSDVKLEMELVVDNKNEERKKELEQKLLVLNEKKHNLVQMLKQILNAEEEIKRRSLQPTVPQTSVPIHAANAAETESISRQAPRLTVDVNFGNDSGGESDVAANHSSPAQLHHLHYASPPAASLSRSPFGSSQNNGNV